MVTLISSDSITHGARTDSSTAHTLRHSHCLSHCLLLFIMRNAGKARLNYERQMQLREQRNRSTDNIIVDPMCDPRHAQHTGLINQYVTTPNDTPTKDKSYHHSPLPRVPKSQRLWT